MIAVDTSLLAYAVNRYAPEHARAAEVLEALANGDRPWALPWPVVHEFVAFVTHPHAASRPLGADEALGFVRSLLESPAATALGPTARHAEVLGELLEAAPRGVRNPPGLELAAVLREHGVRELLSADPGMRRYPFVSVVDPVHGPVWSPTAPPRRRYRRLATAGARTGASGRGA